ncbi:hypothetical protein GCM10027262_05690 [Nocardia tengchongensis]
MQDPGDRGGESGFAVVDMADGADIDMRLRPLESRLRHWNLLRDRRFQGRQGGGWKSCEPGESGVEEC